MATPEKMKMQSPDGFENNIRKIAELFPQVMTETSEDGTPRRVIDFDKLKQVLSGHIVEGDEAYEFTWVGKHAGRRNFFSVKCLSLEHGNACQLIYTARFG